MHRRELTEDEEAALMNRVRVESTDSIKAALDNALSALQDESEFEKIYARRYSTPVGALMKSLGMPDPTREEVRESLERNRDRMVKVLAERSVLN